MSLLLLSGVRQCRRESEILGALSITDKASKVSDIRSMHFSPLLDRESDVSILVRTYGQKAFIVV